jgi:hypothetical protein
MHDYGILLHYDLIKLKNYILEIRRNPKKLVSYLLFVSWILLIMLPALAQSGQRALQVTKDTAEIVLGLYTLLVAVLLFTSFYTSLRKLSYSFQMGDVNLLFPSPLAGNRILFWSLLKKIPTTLVKTTLPALALTPTFLNLGFDTERMLLVYLSMVSIALLITPVSFLIFLLSSRYGAEKWCRLVLLFSVSWLVLSWLIYVKADLLSLKILLGYHAPGVFWFPILGWIIRLAHSAFFGVTSATYLALTLMGSTTLVINILLFILAKDYYEDVLDFTEKMDNIRTAKQNGKVQGLIVRTQGNNSKPSIWARHLKRKQVIVKAQFTGGWAFMYNQVVNYRRTGINEYVGYLTLVSVLVGLLASLIAYRKGSEAISEIAFGINSFIVYILLFRGFSGPLSVELSLPFFYTAPGTFRQKALAVYTLPTLRFAVNILLLNLSYTLGVALATTDLSILGSALVLPVLLTSLYFAQSNCIALGHVLLPSSIDRKLFYPLLLCVEILLISIPAALVGGSVAFLTRSMLFTEMAVAVANFGIGTLLLLFSDRIFPYLEMREFAD